jgi:hypothetical protein
MSQDNGKNGMHSHDYSSDRQGFPRVFAFIIASLHVEE